MSVQSLDRAFDILELLSRERRGMMLTDIGRAVDLHKSTVFRLLDSLRERGYIEKDSESGNYRLGLGFIALTSQYLNSLEIKTEAEPYLRRLSDKLGKTVFLATLRDDEVVYLDKVERFDGLRRYSIIGRRAPIYCTSLGKSLVMDRTSRELRELFYRISLNTLTDKTITDIDVLIEELEKSRTRGWSEDNGEFEVGVNCVGAPVKDYRGSTIAAISSAWEGGKANAEHGALGETLKNTADEISRHLGYFSGAISSAG